MKRKCFVIAPRDTDTSRKFSDFIVKEALRSNKIHFDIENADQINQPGNLSHHIIKKIKEMDLVIADLTNQNLDVIYALGIRDSLGKPTIKFIDNREKLPFLLYAENAIEYSLKDFESGENAKKALKKYVDSINFTSENLYGGVADNFQNLILQEIRKLESTLNHTCNHSDGKCFEKMMKSLDERNQEDIEKLKEKLHLIIKHTFQDIFQYTDVQALANVFTPKGVAEMYEKKASEIWIATTKLDKDLDDPYIKDIVRRNLRDKKRNVSYVYFVPKTDHIQKNINRFDNNFKRYKNKYKFIILPGETILLFEEIAIYNPNRKSEIMNALSLTSIDDRKEYVYVRQSRGQAKEYVRKLRTVMINLDRIEEELLNIMRNHLYSHTFLLISMIEIILNEIIKERPVLTKKKYEEYYNRLCNAGAKDHVLIMFKEKITPLLYEEHSAL